MKHVLCIAALFLLSLATVAAQGEDDFAARIISKYGKAYSLSCKTVGPEMMKTILKSKLAGNEETADLLKQIKTMRVIFATFDDEGKGSSLYTKTRRLAERNSQRYTLTSSTDDSCLFTRRSAGGLKEVIYCQAEDDLFILVDITGTMTDSFLQQIVKH